MPSLTVRTPSVSHSGLPIVVDVAQLRALANDLRRASVEANKALRTGMHMAAEVVAADARKKTDYSNRIPGSIKVSVGRVNFKVSAGGDAAPDAAPIENRGKGHVRHPVFANPKKSRNEWTWTDKNSRPAFLAPALYENADRVAKIVIDAVGDAVTIAIEGK